MSSTFLSIVQVIVSVLLIGAILLQNRSGGVGGAFGGSGTSYHTKRGFERTIFIATIVLGILFVAMAVIVLLTQKI